MIDWKRSQKEMARNTKIEPITSTEIEQHDLFRSEPSNYNMAQFLLDWISQSADSQQPNSFRHEFARTLNT